MKLDRLIMGEVLAAYLARLQKGDSHEKAVMNVARKFSRDPWVVVGHVGLLARCTVDIAQRDMGLNACLEPRRFEGRASREDMLMDTNQLQRCTTQPLPKLAVTP